MKYLIVLTLTISFAFAHEQDGIIAKEKHLEDLRECFNIVTDVMDENRKIANDLIRERWRLERKLGHLSENKKLKYLKLDKKLTKKWEETEKLLKEYKDEKEHLDSVGNATYIVAPKIKYDKVIKTEPPRTRIKPGYWRF